MIDSHVHIWDQSRLHYAWLSRPPFNELPSQIGVDDLPRTAEIAEVVLIEAGVEGLDTPILLEAAQHRHVRAVVPALPHHEERLELLLDDPFAKTMVKAVRWQAQRVPDGVNFNQIALQKRLAPAVRAGLTVEVVVKRQRAREAITAALAAGASKVVVDHLAALPVPGDSLERWRKDIDWIATQPAVLVKVSGLRALDQLSLVTEACAVLNPARLLWGSDWPAASVQSVTYDELIGAVPRTLANSGFTATQIQSVMDGTARACYGIAAGGNEGQTDGAGSPST